MHTEFALSVHGVTQNNTGEEPPERGRGYFEGDATVDESGLDLDLTTRVQIL